MEMTQIQRDALARARRGDFELADAIELEARINRNAWSGDVVCGYRAHRLIALGEGEQDAYRCGECRGSGEDRCEACNVDGCVECPQCAGEATVPGPLAVDTECPKCAGAGEIDCPECDGDRTVDCTVCDGGGEIAGGPIVHRIVDLNGRVLWDDEEGGGDEEEPEVGELVDLAWAEDVIREYHKAAAEGAATTTTEEAA